MKWNAGLAHAGSPPVIAIPVVITNEEIECHVVDEGIDIEMALQDFVNRVTCYVVAGNRSHSVVSSDCSRLCLAFIDGIIIAVVTTEVDFHEVLIGTLVEMIQSPINPVYIKMGPPSVDSDISQFHKDIVGELISIILGFIALPEMTVGEAVVIV